MLEAILCDAVERRMVDIEYTRFATNVDEIAEHDSNFVFDRTQNLVGCLWVFYVASSIFGIHVFWATFFFSC